MRCQRCRERELECVYEPTSSTMPPPTPSLMPVPPQGLPRHASSTPLTMPLRPPGGSTTFPQNNHPFDPYAPSQSGQVDNMYWGSRGVQPFGHSSTSGHTQPSYLANGSWGTPMPSIQNAQSAPYSSSQSSLSANRLSYHSPSESTWTNSPYSSTDPL